MQVRVEFLDDPTRSIVRNVKVRSLRQPHSKDFLFCRGSRPALLCGGLLLLTRPLCFQGPVRQDDILVLMESEREARRLR